jgi:hypothetical protein
MSVTAIVNLHYSKRGRVPTELFRLSRQLGERGLDMGERLLERSQPAWGLVQFSVRAP